MRLMATALMVGATLLPVPAMANWKYTEWGMTPSAVIAASGGTARPGDRSRSAQGDATKDVVTSFDAKGRPFDVSFYFAGGQLSMVLLGGHDQQACTETQHDLEAVYGAPVEASSSRVVNSWRWLDRSKDNRIKLLIVGSYCELQYTPLASAAASEF